MEGDVKKEIDIGRIHLGRARSGGGGLCVHRRRHLICPVMSFIVFL